ncbi:MAG: tRNA (N6-isopentenyl adenosine(37)-C2)-methylthiotransferase MiaB [Pelagibacteraceae bacterium]|nr:tRNA (N6-isopentenyl adenosine(37)-C2)-methylthiotransferase MiaB [Pelagibacteraceae bacterium]
MSKKIFIKTFGCQMNEYDSNRILDLVRPIGYLATDNPSEADCYILNTCHIREKATDKVYHDIGRLKKEFRNKKKPMLLVAGCVAQAENQEMLNREKYIDGVVGPQSYHQIPEIIKKVENKIDKLNSTEFEVVEKFDTLNLIKNSNTKISSFLTIQEGCDKFCHFCVVPYTRGPEFSRSFDEVINEAKQLVENGSKEITLLGQNVNAYKYISKTNIIRLSDLIFELNKFKELKRIRYTTSHPKDVTKDLIEAHQYCEKLMPVLHLPVQSGSSNVLNTMNRKHNISYYHEIIEKLKKAKPGIRFSSDFIIGYPGETDDDFNQTLKLIQKVKFINSYSFIYSSRPGTPASDQEDVDPVIAKKRLVKLQTVLEKNNFNYKKELLNKSTKVLFENKLKDQNKYFGRDKFLNAVVVESTQNLTGQILDVNINNFNHNSLFGVMSFKEKNFFAA